MAVIAYVSRSGLIRYDLRATAGTRIKDGGPLSALLPGVLLSSRFIERKAGLVSRFFGAQPFQLILRKLGKTVFTCIFLFLRIELQTTAAVWTLICYGCTHGLGFPHSEQNFPLLTVPHSQVHGPAGRGVPHSGQNFPVLTAPHWQVQEVPVWAAAICGVPVICWFPAICGAPVICWFPAIWFICICCKFA